MIPPRSTDALWRQRGNCRNLGPPTPGVGCEIVQNPLQSEVADSLSLIEAAQCYRVLFALSRFRLSHPLSSLAKRRLGGEDPIPHLKKQSDGGNIVFGKNPCMVPRKPCLLIS